MIWSQIVTVHVPETLIIDAPCVSEQGVAMLSSALNSDRAIMVDIHIMRALAKLREMISTHKDLRKKIDPMERKYDRQFKSVFDALRRLLELPKNPAKVRDLFRMCRFPRPALRP
jgi:hypothetical protein